MSFTLHPRLAAGGVELARKFGCVVLLKNNAVFPWLILVPECEDGIEELHQLPIEHYGEVMAGVRAVSGFVCAHFRVEKLNVASIGNQIRQLHIHVVGRSTEDPVWPGVVWGYDGKRAYTEEEIEVIRSAASEYFV